MLRAPTNARMNKLAVLNSIELRIAKVETLDEAKGIRDQAEALRVYAKSARAGLGIQNRAAKIKILAERKAGQILKALPKKSGKHGEKGKLSILESLQIPIATGHGWEAISEIPAEVVDRMESEKTEAGEELTSSGLFELARANRKEGKTQEPIETPAMPGGKFRTIVIDPPWPMEKIVLKRRPVEKEALDYPVMTLDDIHKLPVADLAAPSGTHIYLWVTHKFLPEGLRLFETWGVRYECLLTWNKPTAQPLWWRFLTEHCLFGKIGSLALLKKGCAVSFNAPQQKHSHKPEAFYDLVRKISPKPRLTLFDYDRSGFQRWGATH